MAEESSVSQSSSQKSPKDPLRQFQTPTFSGSAVSPNANMQMFPIMCAAFVPGLVPSQNQEQMNRGAGIYAVPVPPLMGPISGLPSNALIPLTYNLPTRTNTSEGGQMGEEHGQAGQPQQQQPAPQRQVVVRRFQIAFQLDVILILKLVAAIFLFNQDGSRQRLVFLVFLASLFYLYQTGAFTPVIRWLSQGMQRAVVPPQPPRPAARAENVPAAARQGNENVAVAEGGQVGAADQNQLGEDGNEATENENVAEGGAGNGGNYWWGFVKEIQMIVVGFITSLLPGFHHVD